MKLGSDDVQGSERRNSSESDEKSTAAIADTMITSFACRKNSLSMRIRSSGSSRRSTGSTSASQLLQDIENVMVAQSGDAGDQVIEEGRLSGATGSLRFERDEWAEIVNAVHPLPDDAVILVDGYWHRDSNVTDLVSPVSPLPSEMASVSAMYDRNVGETEAQKRPVKLKSHENQNIIPKALSYASCITHMAVFGIFGVFARHGMKKLFGPNGAAVTRNQSPLYPDLPANMVACFLMGWMGIVFKDDLRNVSECLAIGLTTGFLGSLSTFSAWTQDMLDLSVKGHWVDAAVELLLGVLLVVMSMFLGVRSAKGFRWGLSKNGCLNNARWKINSFSKHTITFLVTLLALFFLWAVSGVRFRIRLEAKETSAELWLACLVGPFGLWLRWRLARLNGQGLGRNVRFNWVPFGTLAANILAAALMPALATIKLAVGTRRWELVVSGIQMGLVGCLGTVSTFAAEIYAMSQSKHPWRADVYIALTIVSSLVLGFLIYTLPVLINHYR